jgi:histidinol-phosphate aminotransferase
LSTGIDYCEAATGAAFDLSMGFGENAIRLNFNENTLGPSPKAIEAAKEAVAGAYRYALAGLLRPHIAEHHGIDEEYVLMGTGSTELLRIAPITRAGNGGNFVAAWETWGGLITVAENIGLKPKRIHLREDHGYAYDIDAMLAAVDSETRIFAVVTPNNPTGSTLSYDEMKSIVDALPKDVLFVLDEAYAHYQPDRKTGLDLVKEGHTNVLATRTFSKAHALAGMRCGYGLAHPDVLKEIKKFGCGPGSINFVGYAAVLGALADPEHPKRSRSYIQDTRAYYEQQCKKMGVESIAGPSPFVLIKLGEKADSVYNELRMRKIFVSKGTSWNLPDYLRISYGREEENQAFFSELKKLV